MPPLVDILLARIELIAGRMFALDASPQGTPDYEPDVMQSFLVRARQRGCSALEALYDHFAAGDGSNLVYFPIFNYNGGNLDVVRQMLEHPRALFGLSDAGAHVGTFCDASATTFMLTHWVRDRPDGRLPLERAVHLLSGRNAAYLGLADRGRIAPGLRADMNLIDPTRLAVGTPRLVRDMPAGWQAFPAAGPRLHRHLGGRAQSVQREGEVTAAPWHRTRWGDWARH